MKALAPFLILAICIAAYYMYLSPTYAEIQELSAKKAEYVAALEKSEEVKVTRDALQATYNAISPDDIKRLEKVVPETASNVMIANNINGLGNAHGLVVRSVKVSPQMAGGEGRGEIMDASKSPYKVISTGVVLAGRYDQFIQFLQTLEVNLHLADVNTLSIKNESKAGPGGGAGSDRYEFTLDILTYSLR